MLIVGTSSTAHSLFENMSSMSRRADDDLGVCRHPSIPAVHQFCPCLRPRGSRSDANPLLVEQKLKSRFF